jgi:nicotinate dehydrogenase subunit A
MSATMKHPEAIRRAVEIEVNGAIHAVENDPNRSLLWVLRDDLGLTGSKYGCGEGECGACTVLVDGVLRRSCITVLSAVAGKRITTIEGLAEDGLMHPLQEAFLEEDALQCGYCTSGMIMAAAALLRRNPDPGEAEIVRHMDGNICRCGTYRRIVAAIRRVSETTIQGSDHAEAARATSRGVTVTRGEKPEAGR